ncbi:PREDICTED: uncharacterized protein LOC104787888 [Camelina sativa]|uniref:Uncharacterized protein LOC104787888 n=1 Tax=Camelina sativa TaxID=90675 RepID=A0ABM0Z8B5_CAMSA|nr:PREDICTED: uncharacterized protein LOC104787888 [Camelina sativa]
MNHFAVQPNAFAAGGDLRSSVSVVERDQTTVVCPKPRRIGLRNYHHPSRSLRCYFSHQLELCESKAETDILDIILTKDGYGTEQVNTQQQVIDSPSPFLCGSPPSRVANPLTQDARFRDDIVLVSSPPVGLPQSSPSSTTSSGRKGGGCVVRGNFGNSPAVRIEGFDCLDRDSRNCSIPALA